MGDQPIYPRAFGLADVQRAYAALDRFRDEFSDFANGNKILPSQDSLARQDEAAFVKAESVRSAWCQALLLIEIAGDQLTAYLKTVTDPCETIAPFTCVRALLEATALAAWLLEPGISVRDRVGRSVAFRYAGLEQQQRFVRLANPIGHPRALRLVEDLACEAEAVGFTRFLDRKGRTTGVATPMPSTTDLVGKILDEESAYRLLSAVAHGHFWAVHQLGFELLSSTPEEAAKDSLRSMKKALQPSMVIYLSVAAAQAFGLAAWYQALYFGWDTAALRGALTRLFDELHLSHHRRFWA